jgi:glycosyltransferase involved in cell wall biosynthesis
MIGKGRPVVGLSAIDAGNLWVGGRYYLHHLVRAVNTLPPEERVGFVDLWWDKPPQGFDPFAEVRPLLEGQRVLSFPSTAGGRLLRWLRRTSHGWRDTRDIFHAAGVDVLFPIAPCADPGVPLISWVTDFQHERLHGLFTPELLERFRIQVRVNTGDARLIVVSSEDVRHDLERFAPQAASRARILRFCSIPTAEWWARDPVEVQRELGLPDRFFVLSNQFSAQKNHMVVFEAVRMLRDRGIDVTVACTGSTYGFHGEEYFIGIERFLDEQGLRNHIRILGLLDRDRQVALMRRGLAMLQPSRFEGWSTIVEDAKALGQTLLLSDLAVHHEQQPADATFLPLDDPGAWANALADVSTFLQPGPRTDAESRGRAHVERAAPEFGRRFVAIVREALQTP